MTDFSLVCGGPAYRLMRRAGLAEPRAGMSASAALVVAAVAWLPLLILSAAAGLAVDTVTLPFLRDFADHTRFLVALPLLVLGDRFVGPALAGVARQFAGAGLVAPADLPAFEDALAEASRRRDSVIGEAILLAAACAGAWTRLFDRLLEVSSWQTVSGSSSALTLPGWWYFAVSLPLFQFLLYRWLWRGIVWTRFLARVARLPLRLVATHPDQAGGLGFLAVGQTSLAIVVFAVSAVLSAVLSEHVLYSGAHVLDFKATLIGFVVLAATLPLAPLLVFAPALRAAKRKAVLEYGRLATAHHEAFEARWIRTRETGGEELLGSPDPSSLADLGATFEAVRRMQTIPVDKQSFLMLAVAAAVPLLPFVALEIPLRDVVRQVVGILA